VHASVNNVIEMLAAKKRYFILIPSEFPMAIIVEAGIDCQNKKPAERPFLLNFCAELAEEQV
jgi:hypothetical protein